uniref:Uncharacterized protein n=1 Tax=Gayliella sp. TaxID=2575623 RepID=A0A4D6WSQ9_9FLOR|nr:hypothetical protein [Gayliella sp.]
MLFHSTNSHILFIQCIDRFPQISLTKQNYDKLSQSNIEANTIFNPIINQSSDNNYKLISRNFFIQLINKFWRETIFLSASNQLSDTYIEKLKSDGLLIYSKEYKNFLSAFSKALINDRIHFSLDVTNEKSLKTNDDTYVKYIWRKGFNFAWPESNCYLLSLYRQKYLSNRINNNIRDTLFMYNLPIFTVINNLNQIILSESSNEILLQRNFVESLYYLYSKYFLNKAISQVKYQALFFINPNDANEYKDYIHKKYVKLKQKSLLSTFSSRFDIYHRLMQIRMKYVDFRLIPDLEELGNLVYHYQYYKNVVFHEEQNFSNKSFQGQPIYFIQPVLAKNKKTGKIELINYEYSNHKQKTYHAAFMNYKTALLAWQKFRQQMFNYSLPNKPSILVYNLESFIKSNNHSSNINLNKILIVPSVQSYSYLKNEINTNNQFNVSNKFLYYYSYLKMLSQKIIWSLTSKQPASL